MAFVLGLIGLLLGGAIEGFWGAIILGAAGACLGYWINRNDEERKRPLSAAGGSGPHHMAMLTIITPCSRPENLKLMRDSIDFDCIDQWIIVHDTTRTRGILTAVFDHPSIVELGHVSSYGSCTGNSQRNVALERVNAGLIYFLDDDNIIHPEFWKIAPMFEDNHFYTWDQQRWDQFVSMPGGIFKGDTPRLQKIDTAQYVIPRYMCRPWKEDDYKADGLFIEDVYDRYKDSHIYVPVVASYYNYLRR